jgi:hypothetical protein
MGVDDTGRVDLPVRMLGFLFYIRLVAAACLGRLERDRCLTIGSSDRGSRLRWTKDGIDDRDKLPSFVVSATLRRST